jgi:isopenicillin N synthase-like dioxygenase
VPALARPRYCDASGAEMACPDADAGLYIRARDGSVHHARFPPDALAFQMGEATQIHTGGLLVATPHCVRAARAPGVSRSTFAVFLQPSYDCPMEAPGCGAEQVGVPGWEEGQDFGAFSKARIAAYYSG